MRQEAIPPDKIYDEITKGLETGKTEPFVGYDRDEWHIWVEEWSPNCTAEYYSEKVAKREGEDEADRKALDRALRQFAKDLLAKPGREPDFEEWVDTYGIYGYQVLFWKERSGEDWSKWMERVPLGKGSDISFGHICRILGTDPAQRGVVVHS